ncbi:MAG: recombinase family protein [Oscillospiraceae bacterium]|nr:recombinase family protein [Oscillospiraceae bacterium]
MIDRSKRYEKEELKERTRRRMHVNVDPENYEFIPEKKRADYYDNDSEQLVGIYVRVSTDDVRQTTSFELQKKYYEDFVVKHPKWKLVKIYADEGISGTSLKHRDAFLSMIADAKAGKLSLIICKNVSRFARNVKDFLEVIRDLAELKNPVGVFFESEAIFSLNEDSQLALTFQSTMAEEESHTRSRSMETSLRMRLDNGIPLTPKLLGYTHDAEGRLVPNPEEAPTVKLAFYMYLYGYSTQQIAEAFIALGRKSYLGNIKWTSNAIVQILRNERHCGDVLTRKTFTLSYRTHKTAKNNGDRPQSRYKNHHEAIISRDDFIATQRMLDNAKFGNKSILPELRVIDDGILKGFVTINPRWAGFKEFDYYQAAKSVYDPDDVFPEEEEIEFSVEAGDFDLRGFEVTRSEFFESIRQPHAIFYQKRIKFSTSCVRKFGNNVYVEMLINPIKRQFAIRPTTKQNRNSVVFAKLSEGKYIPKDVPAAAFTDTLYSLFGWNTDYKYRILGSLYEYDDEIAYIFETVNSEAFFKPYVISGGGCDENGQATVQPMLPSGKRIRAIPEEWTNSFGKQFYAQERSFQELERQSEQDWMLHLEGQLFDTGTKLNVTGFDELREYIQQELSGLTLLEVVNEQ